MSKLKLTKRLIDSLASSDPRGTKFFDSEVSGFGVKVYSSGKKTFILRYGPKMRRREYAIGPYGPLTLETARQKARHLLGSVIDGKDPVEERKETSNALTLNQWVSSYIDQVEIHKKTIREDKRYLGQVQTKWGHRAVGELSTGEIEREFRRIVDSGKPTVANRWLASLRSCLQLAWRRGIIETNPAMRVKPVGEPTPRSRVLSEIEYNRLVAAIDELPDPHTKAAFRLLIETGARLSEVLHAKWEDIDFRCGLWRIPSPKSGNPQVIPLLPEVVTMLKSLPASGLYVIAGRLRDQPRSDLKRPWKALLEIADIKGVTIHDLRRTFGLQITQSSGLHVASKLLRHSDIRVTERHYAPLDIDDQRKALEKRKSSQS